MLLSNKQAWQLYLIVVDTLKIHGSIAFSVEDRQKLVDAIINQQSDEVVELPEQTAYVPSIWDTNEYAVLRVLKSAMPPNSSLVICYDDGSGVLKIDDDLYPDMVVVRREDKP